MKITQSKAKKMMANIKIEVSENDYSEKVNDVLKKYRKDIYRYCSKSILKADDSSDFIRPEKSYFKQI